MTSKEKWLSVEGIAEHLGISKETVYRWLDSGKIPAHRIGKLWKFKPTEVDNWIKKGGAATNSIDGTKGEYNRIRKSSLVPKTKGESRA